MKSLTFRPPTLDDAQATLDLMIACDIAEYGEPDSSLEDLLDQWDDIDLQQDAWLAFTPDNCLVGYACVSGGITFFFDLYTRPSPEQVDLNVHLLSLCEARAIEQSKASGRTSDPVARIIFPHVNQAGRQAVDAVGFTPRLYHFRMQIELDAPPPPSAFPPGVTLRTVIPGQDDRMLHEFIQTAFDRPGRTPQSFEGWRAFMMRSDHFIPELWFLAFHGDELVGAILCYDYDPLGWVRQLGVAENWRRQGLGAALLRHAFDVFYQRGRTRVALGVESDNQHAIHFYEGIGMHCVRQFDEYEKTLRNSQI